MSQSMEEAQQVSVFFESYPLQSHKADQFAIWIQYVDSLAMEIHSGKRDEVGIRTTLKYDAWARKLASLKSSR